MRGWRLPTWLIAGWTVFIGIGLVNGLRRPITSDAQAAGTGIGVFIIVFVYVLILIPLALLWFGTRPRT